MNRHCERLRTALGSAVMIVALLWGGTALAETSTTPSSSPSPSTADIYNYHAIDANLSTAGQVKDTDVETLAAEGFDLVINLAVADAERNAQEAFMVAEKGIAYINIPVVWDTPELEELQLFFDVMDSRGERRTLVHCFANYRASAFTYLYRRLREGVDEEAARRDLEAIWTTEAWEEYPQWAEFMEQAKAAYAAPDAP